MHRNGLMLIKDDAKILIYILFALVKVNLNYLISGARINMQFHNVVCRDFPFLLIAAISVLIGLSGCGRSGDIVGTWDCDPGESSVRYAKNGDWLENSQNGETEGTYTATSDVIVVKLCANNGICGEISSSYNFIDKNTIRKVHTGTVLSTGTVKPGTGSTHTCRRRAS